MSMRLGSSLLFSTPHTTSEFLLHANQMIWTHLCTDDESVQDSSALVGALLSDAVQVFVVSRTRENRSSEIEVLLQKVLGLHNFFWCMHDVPLSALTLNIPFQETARA